MGFKDDGGNRPFCICQGLSFIRFQTFLGTLRFLGNLFSWKAVLRSSPGSNSFWNSTSLPLFSTFLTLSNTPAQRCCWCSSSFIALTQSNFETPHSRKSKILFSVPAAEHSRNGPAFILSLSSVYPWRLQNLFPKPSILSILEDLYWW